MAHFILEYSANLDPETLDLQALFAKFHAVAVASGLFPIAGLRSRAHVCEHFRVADGTPDYGFVHLMVRLGAGRTEAQKKTVCKAIFEAMCGHLNPLYEQQGLAISMEMSELPEILKFNQNNLRDYIK